MLEFIVKHESVIRVSFFIGTLTVMAAWEFIAPRRVLTTGRTRRWLSNLGVVLFNSFIVRVVVPTLPVAFAFYAEEKSWGILNNLNYSVVAEIIIAVIVLDCIIYLQHVMFHAVPILWRLHQVHHSDMDLDVTSGNRFHPIEILVSIGVKMAAVALVGPSAVAVIIFEVILNAFAQFNHANAYVPLKFDRLLRLFFVTPDMHRVHHSVEKNETNSNFGFFISWWDRFFGTYKFEPARGQTGMDIGLKYFRDPRKLGFFRLLAMPFLKSADGYAITDPVQKKFRH